MREFIIKTNVRWKGKKVSLKGKVNKVKLETKLKNGRKIEKQKRKVMKANKNSNKKNCTT